MLATNPVDPAQYTISFQGPAGPATPYPRRSQQAPFPVGKFLAASAIVLGIYAVAGSLGADQGTAVVDRVPQPAAKVAPAVMGPVATPVPGDFRLGPGNNDAPGVVVRLGVPSPFPGDFRLAPGNNQPAGIVPAR